MLKDRKIKSPIDAPEKLNRLVSGTSINGDVQTESNFRLDGKITGNLHCNGKFVLGEKGVLIGNLKAVESEIEGEIQGDLSIENLLVLKASSKIIGTIQTNRIVIEDGAQIGGALETQKSKEFKPLSNNLTAETGDIVY
ncbi:MAG: polymer-forming cytoskeletal protein [Crocinitomicaceae bacterium]|nr:polymer-forming cytoskeletal protein [Crocinitomicaceae bacterium]